jgi:hypothetical protein
LYLYTPSPSINPWPHPAYLWTTMKILKPHQPPSSFPFQPDSRAFHCVLRNIRCAYGKDATMELYACWRSVWWPRRVRKVAKKDGHRITTLCSVPSFILMMTQCFSCLEAFKVHTMHLSQKWFSSTQWRSARILPSVLAMQCSGGFGSDMYANNCAQIVYAFFSQPGMLSRSYTTWYVN